MIYLLNLKDLRGNKENDISIIYNHMTKEIVTPVFSTKNIANQNKSHIHI